MTVNNNLPTAIGSIGASPRRLLNKVGIRVLKVRGVASGRRRRRR